MPVQAKIVLTVSAAVVLFLIFFIKKVDRGSKSNWLWRGGANDPIRKAITTNEGGLSTVAKLAPCFVVAAWLLLWLVA